MKLKFCFWIKTALILLILSSLSIKLVSAQEDGLDQNSFETPADQDQPAPNQDFTIQDNGNGNGDDSFEIEPANGQVQGGQGDINQNQPVEPIDDFNTNNPNAENMDFDPNAPVFDQGALPEVKSPQNLSEQIRDMNPDSLTGQQDYFPSFIYDERGRKDPFAPKLKASDEFTQPRMDDVEQMTTEQKIRAGLAKFEVSALTLTAILIGKQSRPKALIKDPAGTVYVIHENDIVGRNNGVVKKIRQGQVVILEYRDQPEGDRLYTTQILSLGK